MNPEKRNVPDTGTKTHQAEAKLSQTVTKPTDQELNVKIAEACGWKWSRPHFNHDGRWHSTPYKDEPDIYATFRSEWAGEPHDIIQDVQFLPHYCSDLNACHEMEKILFQDDLTCVIQEGFPSNKYAQELVNLTGKTNPFHATARQKAEAFARVRGAL
jgi:hypothetical protein